VAQPYNGALKMLN